MRIIKDSPDYIRIIAGEMANIESSTHHYIDGAPITLGEEYPSVGVVNAQNYRGYPRITDDNRVMTLRAAMGVIFVPAGTDIDKIERQLAEEVRLMNNYKALDGRANTYLNGYQTISYAAHTNVKIVPKACITKLNADQTTTRVGMSNIIRQFIRDPHDARRARFVWLILPIDRFQCTIEHGTQQNALVQHAVSIFYDGDDICTLGHNSITFDFSKSLLRGSARLLPAEKLTARLLIADGNPLLFELSDFWRDWSGDASTAFRNIHGRDIYQIDHDKIQLRPVRISDRSDDASTEICTKCKSVLWGDNYVLMGCIDALDSHYGVAICPLCFNSTPDDRPIEMKYLYIFRVTFPRTMEEMINSPRNSENKRDLLREALKSIKLEEKVVNGRTVSYALIGDKYAAFAKSRDYLFTQLSNDPDLATRIVTSLILIK
jgi:hypothetical protein